MNEISGISIYHLMRTIGINMGSNAGPMLATLGPDSSVSASSRINFSLHWVYFISAAFHCFNLEFWPRHLNSLFFNFC
jgi:hypothetical protein